MLTEEKAIKRVRFFDKQIRIKEKKKSHWQTGLEKNEQALDTQFVIEKLIDNEIDEDDGDDKISLDFCKNI